MIEVNKNISWVEPNLIYSETKDLIVNGVNSDVLYETIPPLENYCVVVDLEVEIMNRGKGGITEPNRTILISWTSTATGKTSVNFFNGTKHTLTDENGNIKNINYLTSNATTFGTFEEVKNEGTNECFGINSIDIQYNSYMVPEVTIEFTDIRGISLFSPEELRHSGVNEEGIGGMVDKSQNIAGSFFKCFFTFPYPRFKLMVKGFYGEPTTYELTVADFRTRFDCNTGNFAATAKFVGYAFSLLNDVTMNALVVSPLNEYCGESYWKNNSSRFVFEDGTPMLKLSEVILRTSKLKDNLNKISNDSVEAQETRNLENQNKKITSILTAQTNLYNSLTNKYISKLKYISKNNPKYDNENFNFVFFINEENFKDIVITDDILKSYNELNNSLKIYGNSLDQYLKNNLALEYKNGKLSYKKLLYEENKEIIEKLFPDYTNGLDIDFNDGKKWYIILYNGGKLNEQIKAIKTKIDNAITENQKQISKITKNTVIEALGFNPTVENITKLILAHFETLMHTIYKCTSNIKKRTASDIGISTTDLLDTKEVGPFPRVDITNVYNGITTTEEGWLGDLQKGVNEEEVKLIEGMLKAVDKFKSIVDEVSQNLTQSGSTTDMNLNMSIPTIPLDIVLNNKIYSEKINFYNDISDFVGNVGLRMFSVLSLYDNIINSSDDLYKMGVADAYNFYAQHPKVDVRFLERLCGSNDVINSRFIINCLSNNESLENEKNNGKWAWNSINDSKSSPMINNFYLSLYDINGKESKILPVSNYNWDEINQSILIGVEPNDMSSYISTNYISGHNCNNIFKIDLNYEQYGSIPNKMVVDNEQFNYVSNLKLTFNSSDYLKEFFYNDERVFAKKFSSINNITNYNPFKGSHLIPSERPLNKENASVSSFTSGSEINNNFYTLNCQIDGGNKEISRKNEGSFSSAEGEIENPLSFTIPTFKGVTNNGKFVDYWSLFGQQEYYDIPNVNARALLFLDTLKLKEEGFNFGGFRFDNYSFDFDKNITAHLLNDKEPFMIVPYIVLLLVGGYYWREKYIKKHDADPLGSFISDERRNQPYKAITYDIDENLFTLRQDIKDILINEFESWVKNDIYGFKVYQSNFEIQPKNGSGLNQKEVIELLIKTKREDIDSILWDNVSDSFYKNYISFRVNDGKLKLFNRETSSAFNALTKLYLKPCMVIKPTKFIYNNVNNNTLSTNGKANNYLNGFIKKLKELYKNDYENAKSEPINIIPIRTSDNIKISLYKYIKILYDKWLSGAKFEDWILEKFYKGHWYFIDSYYNKVGDRVMMNMPNICSDIIYSQKENGYSLLSFLSKSYASNRFAFHCVQNFMDLKNEHEDAKFKKMFNAIPYNEIDFNNVNFHPAFILMYTYEYSSKLDIKNGEYKNDSFDITGGTEQLPTQITTKRDSNGFRIPAFGVTYGKQYQHFFKNIDISTDNPIVTEEAIKTQFMIAGMNSKNGENGKKIEFLGQDLYTVYSNNSYTCTVKMMGCAWIQPLMYFQLSNIPMFRGAYLIQKVSHHIEPGNMETTFVGVRMAKQSTRLVDDPIFENDNDKVAPQVSSLIDNTLAEVTNDCKYAFYNPIIDVEFAAMSEEDLNLTLDAYSKKYGHGNYDSTVTPYTSLTVNEFLARVVKSEAENQDELGKELVAVVLFNRYMYRGKNLTKIFYDSQHAFNKEIKDGEIEIEIVKNIFTNSPSYLVGKMTNVKRSIPILYNYKPNGNYTQPVNLTIEMLKTMDGYCTTRGYHLNGEYDGIKKEPKDWWHKVNYVVQHDDVNGNWGHVFVAGAYGDIKEYWQEPKIENSDSESTNPSKLAVNLFECIKKTVKTSQAIKINTFEMENDIKGDENTFYIVATPKESMIDIFDATVNTYYDYFSECNWIVENSGVEEPVKIRIKAETNANKRVISISDLNNKPLNDYEQLHKHFYISLKKRYGIIDTNNKEIFKMECVNFNSLVSNDIGWVEITNNILNNKIEPCGGEVNLPIIEGFQWNGNSHEQNTWKPKGNINDGHYEPDKIGEKAYDNATGKQGGCAAAVRQAMLDCGANFHGSWPFSACKYVDFMQNWGYKIVYEGFGANSDGYEPLDNDIVVIAGDYNKHIHGHIQIRHTHEGKTYWISDYKGETVWCYGDEGRPYIIYRWNGNNEQQA